jgi:hypothetical protein
VGGRARNHDWTRSQELWCRIISDGAAAPRFSASELQMLAEEQGLERKELRAGMLRACFW